MDISPPEVPFGYTSEEETESNFGNGKPMTPKQISLYYKIKKVREESDELETKDTLINFPNHPLVDEEVFDEKDDDTGVVETVAKEWYDGWYWKLIIRYGTSHGVVFVYNESSEQQVIQDAVEEFKENHTFPDVDFEGIIENEL